MRIAKYWHRAEATTPDTQYQGQSWTRFAWGWSNDSPEAARAMAERRASEVVQRVARADLAGNDWDDWYAYSDRALPELVVDTVEDEHGVAAGALTINRYGATILNTARLPIIDVDLPSARRSPPSLGEAIGTLARMLLGRPFKPSEDLAARENLIGFVSEWVKQEPGRGARVYQTAAGLRHILLAPEMDPDADDTQRLMAAFNSDPLYANLCKSQQCFRARLTPKPWRLGISAPDLTFATLTSNDPATEARVRKWFDRYEAKSAGHAVCRLVATFGVAQPRSPESARLLALHDDMALGDEDALLA